MADQWYYTVAGQQSGPITADELRGLIAAGQVSSDSLAWCEGMAQWTALSLLPELVGSAPQQYANAPASPYATAPASPYQQQQSTPLQYGGYQQYGAGQQGGVEYASFWIRVGAYIIDYLVLLIPNYILGFAFGLVMGTQMAGSGGAVGSSVQAGGFLLLWVVQIVLNWLYWALMDSSAKQGTIGKIACGLIVTDINGHRLTFGRATGRYFAKILSFMICFVGVIMVAFDEQRRGLHDQIAKTFVVKKDSVGRGFPVNS